jgi:hypothetical protein
MIGIHSLFLFESKDMINIYDEIFKDVPSFGLMAQVHGMDVAITFHDEICRDDRRKPFQSIAMQTGLASGRTGVAAFEYGAALIDAYKDHGTYDVKIGKSASIQPKVWYSEMEYALLHTKAMEDHAEPVLDPMKEDCIVGKYNKHYPRDINMEFIRKVNQVPFELEHDVVLNFEGENMPENYDQMVLRYLTDTVYFNWGYDARGRSYSNGYGLNIQGNKTVRAALNFKNKEVIKDPTPVYIALANAMGKDKMTWKQRIAYGKKFKPTLSFKIPPGCEEPEVFAKARRALFDYHEGNKSGFPMELDATASGLQIMAVLARCKETGKRVNLVNTGKREDIYDAVADGMNQYPDVHVDRSKVKKPVMTHWYNSEANPRESFTDAELEAFYKVLEGLLPGAELVMKYLNTQWNPKAKAHEWTLPDGHIAYVKTMTRKTGMYLYMGCELKYMYYVNEGNLNDFRSLMPNIVHSIDGWIARQMVLRADFEMVHIHD